MRFNLTLAQKDRDNPAFASLANCNIIGQIHDALAEAECWFGTKEYTLKKDGFDNFETTPPRTWAVGRHQSGDIWIAATSAAEHNMLVQTVPS